MRVAVWRDPDALQCRHPKDRVVLHSTRHDYQLALPHYYFSAITITVTLKDLYIPRLLVTGRPQEMGDECRVQ